MTWTHDRLQLLKKLCADPIGLTFSEIAAELGGGLSRNACIGKARRLGLAKPTTRAAPVQRGPRKPRSKPIMRIVGTHGAAQVRQRELPPEPIEDLDIPLPQRKSFLDLNAHTCRWPVGDPPDLFFCGAPPIDTSPYCPWHHRVAVAPAASRGNAAGKPAHDFRNAPRFGKV